MQRFGKLAEQAFGQLAETSEELQSRGGELLIWRRQDHTRRAAGSKTASGINPEGTDFETTDHVVQALRTPSGEETLFYGQFDPQTGDLLITLYGDPQTKPEARKAPASSFYRVTGTDSHTKGPDQVLVKINATSAPHRDHEK